MIKANNIPIIGKFLFVLAVFAAFSLGSVIFSTGKMRHIDDAYSALIDQQSKAAVAISEANRSIARAQGSISGLVMATTDEDNQKQLARLGGAKASFVESMNKAKSADASISALVDDLTPRGVAILTSVCAKTIKLGAESTVNNTAAQAEYAQQCDPAFETFSAKLIAAIDQEVASADKMSSDLTDVTNATILITYASVLGGVALVILGAYFAISAWVSRPIKDMGRTMQTLAGGDLAVSIVGTERKDEIGPMAQALQVFKDNGLKLRQSEADAARARQAADQERAANEAARVEIQRQQEAMVAAIAGGLNALSKGDLTGRLDHAFAAEYEKLRADFNATATSLQATLGTIYTATNGISSGSDQIAHASDDLARRTEQQAASLEETAAALNLITDTVKAMAANAGQAADIVVSTRASAESSGAIVQQAVDAMSKIQDSSRQIGNIIGVIDEIAFQTNLLALNAGVEAARAGEAGRGFAVVASEVRALAQRSAEAAKEIKGLISSSTVQVESGVVLVDKTGVALKDIFGKVAEMETLVRGISTASQEQATSIDEINIAVRQMDQVVQQNAAMVEESTAAAHTLKSETQDLANMVGRFQLGDNHGAPPAAPAPRGNPVHAAQAKLAKAVRPPAKAVARPMMKTTSAVAQAPADDWEEF